jgi:hypothetical protein
MTREQIEQLIADYYKCEFGLAELINRTESVVLENVRQYISSHNLKAGDYLFHVADKDVLITAFYTRKMYDELKGN